MLFVACPLSLHALFVPGCLLLLSGGGYGCLVAQDLISLWKIAFPRTLDVPLSHYTEFRNDYVPNMSNPLLQQTLNEEKNSYKAQVMENSEIILCSQLPCRYRKSILGRKWPEVYPLVSSHSYFPELPPCTGLWYLTHASSILVFQ